MPQTPMDTPFKLPKLPTYPGGKGADGTVQRLINLIPPHRVYVEPFLGGGAVMRYKRPAKHNLGFALDRRVLKAWEDAPRWCTVSCANGLDKLESMLQVPLGKPNEVFILIDAPYRHESTRTSARYNFSFTHEDQLRLLSIARKLPAMVMVCHMPDLVYENGLQGWRTLQYQSKGRRGLYWEQVWMNYPEPTALHDYRYLGSDYRERELVRDRINRRLRDLASLPPLERMAVLDRMLTTFNKAS